MNRATLSKHARLVRDVHIAKSKLGWDDGTYRDILARHGRGAQSSKQCTVAELEAVMRHADACGYKRPVRRRVLMPQERKLYALWQTLFEQGKVGTRTFAALEAWAARQTGVERMQWLGGEQLRQLIEALKGWVDRDD